MKRVYLDNSASTPVDKRVLEKMLPYFSEKYGNASSVHFFGQEAQSVIDQARGTVADFLNAKQKEIVFTSSATEASNLAIIGSIKKFQKLNRGKIPHIVTSEIEHESILKTVKHYTELGYITSSLVSVSELGFISLEDLKNKINNNTILVSIMHANNEVGTIQNIKEISLLIRKFNKEREINKEILFHTDSAQSANFLKCDVDELGVDMLTLSGHKIYGPKGSGVLYVKEGSGIDPLITGSGQEAGLRSGTENIPAIVGLAEACKITEDERKNLNKIKEKRDRVLQNILKKIPNVVINGDMKNRVHHNLNLSFLGVDKNDLVMALDMNGFLVSAGSACYSKSVKVSHVLRAMGKSESEAKSAIRIALGRNTTDEDLDRFVETLSSVIERLRR